MTHRQYLFSSISRGAFIAAERGQMPLAVIAEAVAFEVMQAIRKARGDG